MPDSLTIREYNETFLTELNRLNEAQREAVEHIEGPVLVIAGPGTGKTHILTARIGRILLETDAQPHNILCLTFTEAGVLAMRERLLEFIGPEAHRVHIYTFHSFCNSIIQDNLELFGRHDLEPLSDLERVEIIRRILDELDINHPLKKGRADIYFYEKHLHDLFQKMKSEDWSIEFVKQKIEEYLEDLPNRKEYTYQVNRGEFRKGDLKNAKLDDTILRMDRLRSATALFPRYIDLLRKYRRYDFADMILWVLRVFEQNTALLRTYQEQYLYFLIDEYQDTNGAQNQIALRLIEYWENPNIFIVGDDDQSIYEFQGARLKNLTDFYKRFESHLKLILLKDNYRSSQNILDTSRALISKNEKRIVHNVSHLGVDKILVAKHSAFSKSKVLPQVLEYPNRLQEEVDIVRQIEGLQKRKSPLREVAIIYAKHKQARNLIELLERKGIPYNTRQKVNILDLPMIQNLRMFLDYLQAEYIKPYSGEHLIFKILHFDFLKILPSDLAKLAVHLAKFDYKKRPTWRVAIGDLILLKKLKLKDANAIVDISTTIEYLLSNFASISVISTLERLINRSGLLRNLLKSEDKIWLIQVLNTFVNFIKKETNRNPRLTLVRLLETLKNMDGNRLPIEINKVVQMEDGVNLLTAHSSKGLEFEHVFMLDCVKEQWEPRNRRSSFQFPFPDTLTFSGEEDPLEARRRLFYVAMTRAKAHLYLSFSRNDSNGKEIQRTQFLDEIINGSDLEITQRILPPELLIDAQTILLQEVAPRLPNQDKATIDSLLEDFSLSVSSMNKYLYCPLNFYYENVLSVPTVMSEAASYGTAMHNALQFGFAKMMLSKAKVFPPADEFIRLFREEMNKLQGNFSKKEFERRMKIGQQNMRNYYDQHGSTWHKKVRLEYELKNVEMDGIPLTGTIDRLELHSDNFAHIVDYKTGNQDSKKMRRPKFDAGLDPYELVQKSGTYYRQLVFYKILYEYHRHHGREVKNAEISYLEPDSKGNFLSKKIVFKAADIAFVKGLIKDTYEKIMAHDFYEGCGTCKWCDFVRKNVPLDSFSNMEIEELDDGK
ncbi:MAG: ATP-dependent DNA helicase [Saprospiraceae bacterium]|jgi:DNA helicase-2/ATP-dependent DNA helicase PcrA|nr:ATP-dependent DNA helicase [Saprospiraceae bacterium]